MHLGIIDYRHYAIELLRDAEKKGMPHDHALNIYRTLDTDLKAEVTFGDAIMKVKYSIFHYLHPDIELGWGDMLCDRCSGIITEESVHVIKDNDSIWCTKCDDEVKSILEARFAAEAEEKERKRLEDEEKRKSWLRS